MFRLVKTTLALVFVSLVTGCTFPPGNLHNPNYIGPTEIQDQYNELVDTKSVDYRTSNPCQAALHIAAAHPSADSLGDRTTRKATALEDLRRGIDASVGSAEHENVCASNTAYLFTGYAARSRIGGSLFEPAPDILTCLRTSESDPRFVTVAELDACLAAHPLAN